MSENLDAGLTGAKRENHDQLLELMRDVLRENPNILQGGAVRLWRLKVREHPDYEFDLRDAIEGYAGSNIYRRLARVDDGQPAAARASASADTERKVKEIIASSIVLWRWKMPTTGKTLADSTFAEVAEAAPIAGKFLAKLAAVGAPGTLVREVFRNEKALQEFWKSSQGG